MTGLWQATGDVRRASAAWDADPSPETLRDLVMSCELVVQMAGIRRPESSRQGRALGCVIVGASLVVVCALLILLMLQVAP